MYEKGLHSTRNENVEENKRIEEILVSISSLVSGLPEATGARFSWVEVSQESPIIMKDHENIGLLTTY